LAYLLKRVWCPLPAALPNTAMCGMDADFERVLCQSSTNMNKNTESSRASLCECTIFNLDTDLGTFYNILGLFM